MTRSVRSVVVPETVVPGFVGDEHQNHQTTGDADGKTEDVDEAETFVFEQVAGGDGEVVLQHGDKVGRSDQLAFKVLTGLRASCAPIFVPDGQGVKNQ
ncbi:MAG: hypothetical protein AAB316_18470 [Bacteroidota bacterium]